MFLLSAIFSLIATPGPADSLKTYNVPNVVVAAPIKHSGIFSDQPVAASSFSSGEIAVRRIEEPKDLSLAVPNFIQADYGSKMTSSIYMRGIGARMEQPSVGMYVDNVPILNKNNYDMDLYDLNSIHVLRGPQGTLYGRNTIGGVIDIHTLSPLYYGGTHFSIGYGNGNTSEARLSTYRKIGDKVGVSAAFSHRYSDGFFTNEYDGSAADRILSEGVRLKAAALLKGGWTLDNTLYMNLVRQHGFAYSLYDETGGDRWPVYHNDPCSYDRFALVDGLTFRHDGGRFGFSSTTSYQYTDDEMVLDQDFRPVSMFTLSQSQRENALTQEFVLRSERNPRWQWITGAFGFYKHVRMAAPVLFKRDGIDELILGNANDGIHTVFPDADLEIREESFPIESDFRLPAWGVSLYHQSTIHAGRWSFTAGVRADFERTAIDYRNSAAINYRLSLTMPDFKELPVTMSGRRGKSYFEFMPKISALYQAGAGNVYATVARGYKAGGYNTQIFSDILQNKMMSDLMSDLGIYLDGMGVAYDVASAISYKPEYSWNYELGGHLDVLDGRLQIDAALFYIDLRDQQLTVFPPGQTTGRLMSNAGRSRSMGVELSGAYRSGRITLIGSYGHTDARFVDYDTGESDYSGCRVPYVPQNTVSLTGRYSLPLKGRAAADRVLFSLGWSGAGRIYWNEANTASQDFYGMLDASVSVSLGKLGFGIWGRNLTGTRYDTFWFRSVGHSFVQKGKPAQFGANVSLTL